MQTAQQLGNPFDAIRDEINTRKEAVNNALNEPAEHLGQYNTSDVTGRASARLEGYRRNSGAMKTYNAATGRLLTPTQPAPQQRTSRLRAPQQGRSPMVTPMQGAGTDSDGLAVALANGGDPHESAGADASRDDTIDRLNKIIRAKNATIQEKAQEVERYKDLHDSFHHSVDDISNDARETTQQIAHLADDLAAEKRSHKAARESLEAKTHEAEVARRTLEEQSVCLREKAREAEQHSMRLAELEQASAAVHDENLELSRRIQEMNNRLAEEQQAAAAAAAVAAESPEGEAGCDGGDRRKEMEKLKQAVEMKTCQLEAVKERAERTSKELQRLNGQARSGRFKSLLLRLWWLLRTVGFLGFLLFVYLAVSEDAFRSRGVDVYRLAH